MREDGLVVIRDAIRDGLRLLDARELADALSRPPDRSRSRPERSVAFVADNMPFPRKLTPPLGRVIQYFHSTKPPPPRP